MPVFTGSRELLASLTGYELTRGVLCCMRRPQLPTVEELLAPLPPRVALVDSVVNSTNTGAIFRAAAALGIDALLLTPTCCDPLNRRSVRMSMGTVFQIPWTYFDGGIDFLHRNGYKVAALALVDDSIAINDPRLMAEEKLVIVLGTEGDGLSRHIIDQCDYRVIIPMSNHVDSLNVAGAASVAFWQLCQR
jgi:tRNA G18 (ribose-2'-O)-methylase SpoU